MGIACGGGPPPQRVVIPSESAPLITRALPPRNESPVAAFIKPVALAGAVSDTRHHEQAGANIHPYRDPLRAIGRIRSGAAGASHRGSAGARAAADAAQSVESGLGVFPEIRADLFTEGTVNLEHRNGAEHNALFDPATSRVIKLTQPGEFGAWRGLEEYVERLAWSNEFFDDDILIEGWLLYPNESAPRLITSQPWYRVNPQCPEPSMAQIDAYMWQLGFLKAYDGAWIHSEREILVSDALPKNFVLDVVGYVQAIDVIVLAPDDDQWDRLSIMARNLPQQ